MLGGCDTRLFFSLLFNLLYELTFFSKKLYFIQNWSFRVQN